MEHGHNNKTGHTPCKVDQRKEQRNMCADRQFADMGYERMRHAGCLVRLHVCNV